MNGARKFIPETDSSWNHCFKTIWPGKVKATLYPLMYIYIYSLDTDTNTPVSSSLLLSVSLDYHMKYSEIWAKPVGFFTCHYTKEYITR
jgi:hypothetical protein